MVAGRIIYYIRWLGDAIQRFEMLEFEIAMRYILLPVGKKK
jgi:hypothetical protein